MRCHSSWNGLNAEALADRSGLPDRQPSDEAALGREGFRCWFLLGACLGWLAYDGYMGPNEFAGLHAAEKPTPIAIAAPGLGPHDSRPYGAKMFPSPDLDPLEPESTQLEQAEVLELPRLAPRELRNFPGIGERRAIAIARARWEHASSPDPLFLDQIEGIGPRTVESVAQFLSERAEEAASGP